MFRMNDIELSSSYGHTKIIFNKIIFSLKINTSKWKLLIYGISQPIYYVIGLEQWIIDQFNIDKCTTHVYAREIWIMTYAVHGLNEPATACSVLINC